MLPYFKLSILWKRFFQTHKRANLVRQYKTNPEVGVAALTTDSGKQFATKTNLLYEYLIKTQIGDRDPRPRGLGLRCRRDSA